MRRGMDRSPLPGPGFQGGREPSRRGRRGSGYRLPRNLRANGDRAGQGAGRFAVHSMAVDWMTQSCQGGKDDGLLGANARQDREGRPKAAAYAGIRADSPVFLSRYHRVEEAAEENGDRRCWTGIWQCWRRRMRRGPIGQRIRTCPPTVATIARSAGRKPSGAGRRRRRQNLQSPNAVDPTGALHAPRTIGAGYSISICRPTESFLRPEGRLRERDRTWVVLRKLLP